MSENIKSGQKIVSDFFNLLKDRTDIDDSVKTTLIQLYEENKLTNLNIANALQKKREEALNVDN